MAAGRPSQALKKAGKTALVLMALLLAYLSVVAWWALASVDQVVAYPPAPAVHLSPSQTVILLKIEDPDFFSHAGLSLGTGQGFATISSAVARDAFLYGPPPDGVRGVLRTFYRRVFECCKKIDLGRDVMALVLNARVTKDRQLGEYVANVYMGTSAGLQVRGLAQASDSYLGKPFAHITDQEFAGLVAMVKAPNYFHPVKNRPAYELRVARVKAILSGKCAAGGWFDTSFEHCTP